MTWKEILEMFSQRGKPVRGEVKALGTNTKYRELAEMSPQLHSTFSKIGKSLNSLAPDDAKALSNIQTLLQSDKMTERMRGMDRLFELLEKQIDTSEDFARIISRAVGEIGVEALRAIPQVEFSYRRYLKKHRKKFPDQDFTFEEFLHASKNNRPLKLLLKSVFTGKQYAALRGAERLYYPAASNIMITSQKANALLTALARSADLLPRELEFGKLLRKLGSAMDDRTAQLVAELLRRGRIATNIADADQEVKFARGLLRNFQGNVGEALAVPKQIERLARATEKGGDAIYLAMDVRVSGRRTILDRKSMKPGDTSVPGYDKDLKSLEFTDDMIVDLGNPPNLRIVEHHETKVTLNSISDGVHQIDDNRERMEYVTSLSIGQLFKYDPETKTLTRVAPGDIPGFKPKKGDSPERLTIREPDNMIEAAQKRQTDLDSALHRIENDRILSEEARLAQRSKALDAYFSAEAEARRNIVGVNSAEKVLFTPKGQMGNHPDHMGIVPEMLEYSYNEIIDICNLLLLRAGFVPS